MRISATGCAVLSICVSAVAISLSGCGGTTDASTHGGQGRGFGRGCSSQQQACDNTASSARDLASRADGARGRGHGQHRGQGRMASSPQETRQCNTGRGCNRCSDGCSSATSCSLAGASDAGCGAGGRCGQSGQAGCGRGCDAQQQACGSRPSCGKGQARCGQQSCSVDAKGDCRGCTAGQSAGRGQGRFAKGCRGCDSSNPSGCDASACSGCDKATPACKNNAQACGSEGNCGECQSAADCAGCPLSGGTCATQAAEASNQDVPLEAFIGLGRGRGWARHRSVEDIAPTLPAGDEAKGGCQDGKCPLNGDK